MVKVSVCIPTYNQTEFLSKNLDSLLQQSFKDFEIIMSDDSDRPEVENLVHAKLQGRGIPYFYHRNNNALGSPANWNKAISLAQGEYIKLLHHDDWLKDDFSLRDFVQALDKNPNADFAFCATTILNVKENTFSLHQANQSFLSELKTDALLLFNNNQIGSPSAMIYRANTKLIFDEKLSYLVDVEFYIRLLQKNKHFVFIPNALIVNTSHHPGQVTAKSITKTIQIGEYCYLYHKLLPGIFPSKKMRVFYKDLFAWYHLNSFDEITAEAYPVPEPKWIFRLLLWQSKFQKRQ
ncbi:MAG: glycosyltransferase family 2 protein [Bacteroidota bacterium]